MSQKSPTNRRLPPSSPLLMLLLTGLTATASSACTDSPTDWVSTAGSNCTKYVSEGWCTGSGGYGTTWNVSDWGTFADWPSSDGVPATEACCGCGGGEDEADGLKLLTVCDDTPADWVSSAGSACAVYEGSDWCTTSGYGTAWNVSDWGLFSDWPGTDGVAADDACCGCGGGDDALCFEQSWTSSAGSDCATYVAENYCTASGGYGAVWNVSEWGTFAEWPSTDGRTAEEACCGCGGGARCNDDPTGWMSAGGYDCAAYVTEGWCTITGGYGPEWDMSTFGSFDDYQSEDGLSAIQACCGCGGGQLEGEDKIWTTCEDEPDWVSSADSDCTKYVEENWCTASGGYGAAWNVSEWGTFDEWPSADGLSAHDACCGCGGGSEGTCFDAPSDWLSSGGSSCTDYVNGDWCTASGGFGEAWNVTEWGAFDEYLSTDGVAADEACCGCGGGQACTEDEDWVSSVGSGCSAYVLEKWCTTSGGYGLAWNVTEWGTFADWPSTDGVTADDACCGCGGGDSEPEKTCITVSADLATKLKLESCP